MKTVYAFLAMAAVGMFAATSHASAQDPCIIVNGVKCYLTYDECQRVIDIDCGEGSTGTAQFTKLRDGDPCGPDGAGERNLDDPNGGPLNDELQPTSINVTVPSALYGQITTTLDASRAAKNTTIISTDEAKAEGVPFPAVVRIRFYAFAVLDSDPGPFVSQTELVFGNDNVNSAYPFENETFTLLEDVNYYRKGDETQATVFTLQAGNTSLTIDGEEGGERQDQLD